MMRPGIPAVAEHAPLCAVCSIRHSPYMKCEVARLIIESAEIADAGPLSDDERAELDRLRARYSRGDR